MQPHTRRVLLSEDGFTETGITPGALCTDQRRGLELVFVSNPGKLSGALLHLQPHIALLALSLLQPDPSLAVSLVHQSAPHIPLILFVHPADKATAFGRLHAGAGNCILEGFLNVSTLDRVLHAAIPHRGIRPVSPKVKSRVYSLTDLPNRAALLHQLQNSSPYSALSDSQLLLIVRLTNLKQLQSAAGHSAVSHALCDTATN
jgi:hypothetical protein